MTAACTPASAIARKAATVRTSNCVVSPSAVGSATAAGSKVLLRYVNAGVKHHSMAVLGLRQNFVAKDAGVLPTLPHDVAAETLAAYRELIRDSAGGRSTRR